MRILVVAGYAKSLILFRGPLLKAFIKCGHEVIACAPAIEYETAACLKELGVESSIIELDRTGMNPFRDFCCCLRLMRLFHTVRPDIVFSYTVKPVVYGSLAARLANVGQIFSMITGLGYAFIGNNARNRAVSWIVCRLYKLALAFNKGVFFQNPDDFALFERLGLVQEENSFLINGSGLDLDYYAPAPLIPNPPIFLLIARLLRDKGVMEYAAAAEILKERHPHAQFQLLGPFDSNPTAIQPNLIRNWNRSGLIEYLGETNDVRPFIAKANIYVLPSYREGTPRTVLEAMAMGRPIVTTDAPGCRETVVDGENGFLVPVQDSVALANAMEKFILEPDLIEKMGKRSREIAADKYDVHKVNAIIMQAMGLIDEENV